MKKIILGFLLIVTFRFCTDIFSQPYVEQNSGVTSGLNSVSVYQYSYYQTNCAWICGNMGVVLRTTNYGVNWVNKSGNGLPLTIDLYNIFCIDSSIALTAGISGNGTYVYRTSNGGNNWQQVFYQSTGFIDAIWMKTSLIGFMVGDPVGGRWSLWRTTNGGINWDSSGINLYAPGTEAGWNNSLYVRNNYILFGTNNHKIYRSTNFGSSWLASPTTDLSTTAFWFYCLDSLYGYYGGDSVHKTTNGGASWTTMTCPGTGSFMGFVSGMMGVDANPYPPMINWTVRGDNKIYRNFNMSSWITDYTAPAGNYYHIGGDFRSPLMYSWAVRSNGGITRVTLFFGEVRKISSLVPENYSLSQNYPNPFNPKSNIKFQIAKLGFVKLVVFDALGREISQLINGPLYPGTYEIEWDGTNYPSGVYFYKLIINDASTPLSITKKMVLIK